MRALIGQSAMVYSWKNRASSEILYKSNRPQVSMVYYEFIMPINYRNLWSVA